MRNKQHYFLFPIAAIIFAAIFISCTSQEILTIGYNNTNLQYMGRTGHTDSATLLYWPGSSVTMTFEGTEVKAMLKDEKGKNYFNAIVDGDAVTKIKLDTIKQLYTLAAHLKKGKHTIQLFKITEAEHGTTSFFGFVLGKKDIVLAPPAPKARKIEFYGNSITCGYSIEDNKGDSREPEYENNYRSYAAITARHYNADYRCIAKSGIGLMLSWFHIIMPEMYDRIDPADSTHQWDFSQFTPQVVIINLFQNDSWLVNKPEHPQFKARFGNTPPDTTYIINAYKDFVLTIRSKYPDAAIICALGSMDATKQGSPWPGYISSAVALTNDAKIYTHFFPYKNTPGHPKVKDQQDMAESLISFIDSTIKW